MSKKQRQPLRRDQPLSPTAVIGWRFLDQDEIEDRLLRFQEHYEQIAHFELGVEPWSVFYRVQGNLVIVELIGRKKGNVMLIEGKEFKL